MNRRERQHILLRYRERVRRFEIIAAKLDRRARVSPSSVESDLQSQVEGTKVKSTERIPTGVALSKREIEVISLVARGFDNAEIGERLFIGVETVKSHVQHCLAKLGARNRAHAVWLAMGTETVRCVRGEPGRPLRAATSLQGVDQDAPRFLPRAHTGPMIDPF